MNLTRILQKICAQQPEKTAFIEKDRSLSCRAFYQETCAIAGGLRDVGIRQGDRILILLPLSVALYSTLCAAWMLGAAVVMFDPSAGRAHIRNCLEELPVEAFVGNQISLLLRLASPPVRKIPVSRRVAELRNSQSGTAVEPVEVEKDTPALITFTSGSTAAPKAIVRTHGFLLQQHAVLANAIPYKENDVDLAVLPVFTLMNLVEGITTVLPDDSLSDISRVNAARLVKQIRRYGVNRITASPALLDRLCGYARQKKCSLSTLQSVHVGGGPVFPDILERMSALIAPRAIEMVYGSTEAEPIATMKWTEVTERQKNQMKSGAGLLAGKPVDTLQVVVIRNQHGLPPADIPADRFAALVQPCGEAGEIIVAGDHVVQGYLRPEQDRENKIRVGGIVWHRTGDCGRFDEEGYLWLLGRAEQVLHIGDSEIYPFAVECAIRAAYGCRSAVCTDKQGKTVLAVEDSGNSQRICQEYEGRFDRIVSLRRIPVDRRHASKVDYVALRRIIS